MDSSSVSCLLAPAPFKGTFGAGEVADIWAESLTRSFPDLSPTKTFVADGGGGTIDALSSVLGGDIRSVRIPGPLGGFVDAEYLYNPSTGTGLVESARVIGFDQVSRRSRDPLLATSFPLGLVLREILEHGGRTVYVGLGDTVTMDYGVGCAAALGFRFTDAEGREAIPGGGATPRIVRLDCSGAHPAVRDTRFVVLADVRTPIFGERSVAGVFGPQKGASDADVAILDAGARAVCAAIREVYGLDIASIEMGGAAGGTAGLMAALLGAELLAGSSFVADRTGLGDKVKRADIVLTGEGTIDEQTLSGKGVAEVLERCEAAGKPVALICGSSALDLSERTGVFVFTGNHLSGEKRRRLGASDLGELASVAVSHLVREKQRRSRPDDR